MTTIVLLVVLCALVAVLVFGPLWSRRADQRPGSGLEQPSAAERRSAAREQVREQLRDLDSARAEGKLDSEAYLEERTRLAAVVADLTSVAGGSISTDPAASSSRDRQPQAYPASGLVGWGALMVGTFIVALVVESADVIRTVSPHANTENPAAESAPVIGADGQPDIGAMVARLEARVRGGDADAEDITMLERTYEVLGRTDELTGMFRTALSANPNNAVVLMALGIRQFEAGGRLASVEAENAFDRLLVLVPELPEALWFKSLLLVRRQEVDAAIELLTKMAELVADDPQAHGAVTELLAELNANREAATDDN